MGQENDPYAYGMSRTHMGRPIRVWDKIRVRDGTQPRKYFQRNFKTVKYLQPRYFPDYGSWGKAVSKSRLTQLGSET